MNRLIRKYRELPIEAKAALWFAICNFLNKGISMIVVPIYTRLLTTAEYGTYSLFQSWVNILAIVVTLEIARGHYRVGITKYETDVNRYTSSVMGLSNIVTLAFMFVFACAPDWFASILEMPKHLVVFLLVYLFVYPAWEFWSIRQRFEYRYQIMVFATLLVAIVSPLIGICGILFFNLQSEAAIFGKLGVQGVVAFALYINIFRRSRSFFVKKYWKEVFFFNIGLVPYLLSTSVLSQADRVMIGKMIGVSEAAIYSVAYSVAMIMQLANAAIGDAFVPWIYRHLKQQKYADIEPATNMLLVGVAGINILAILFAPEVLSLFAPEAYGDALWVIPPLTASVYFMFIFQRYINVEVYYGNTVKTSTTSICVALLNMILNYVCIRHWGYLAAGYTTLFCYIVFCVVHHINLRKLCKEKCENSQIFTAKTVTTISAIFLVSIAIIMLAYPYNWLRYALAVALAMYTYKKRNFISLLLRKRRE